MNIEGGKMASVLQAGAPIEGRGQSQIGNEGSPSGFADALIGQMESLAEVEVQVQLPVQNKISVETRHTNLLNGLAEFSRPSGDQQFFLSADKAPVLEKLGVEAPDSEDEDLNLTVSGETVLSSLSLNTRVEKAVDPRIHEINKQTIDQSPEIVSMTESQAQLSNVRQQGQMTSVKSPGYQINAQSPGDVAKTESQAQLSNARQQGQMTSVKSPGYQINAQSPGDVARTESQTQLSSPQQQEQLRGVKNSGYEAIEDRDVKANLKGAKADFVEESCQKNGENETVAPPDLKKGRRLFSAREDDNPTPSLTVLHVLPLPSMPMEAGVNLKHSASEPGQKNAPQSFMKPLMGDYKAKVYGTTENSEDGLQNSASFNQSIKENPNPNEIRSERMLQTAGGDLSETRASVLDIDKTLSRGMAHISQDHRPPVENRVELPALTKPLAHPQWNKDLGERIVWMNNKELSAAEIRLNPQHLGPISVRIEMNNDQATIVFTAEHAVVRDALEASIPKLREMMNDQQLNLVNVNIAQNNSSGQQHQSSSQRLPLNFDGFDRLSESLVETGEELENQSTLVSKGILSIYA